MLLPRPILIVFAGVFGSFIGSFLNVCVYRLPREQSVIRPRSRCPACERPIAWYDNVPVLSFLFLAGRCRHCRARISVQYPIVELLVALLWAGCVVWYGPSIAALSTATLSTLLVGIALTDARHYMIPDEFSVGGLGAGLAFSLAPGGLGPIDAALGAALGFGVLWVVKTIGDWALRRGWIRGEEVREVLDEGQPPSAMGHGDLKMMAMVGSFLGWRGVLLTVFLGAAAGTVVFVPLMLMRRRIPVPFGVFLAIGALATLVGGDRLIAWYGALVYRP